MNKNNLYSNLIHPPKNISILLLIILLFIQVRYGIIPGWQSINSDFPNYYTSSRLLLEGKDLSNIYNDQWFQQKIHDFGITEPGKFSPFPPPSIFIMLPVSPFPPLTAKRIFLIINLVLLIFTAYIFTKISQFNLIECLNILMLSGIALVNNMLLGQFYIILLLLVTLGYYYLINKKEYPTGIIWGIAAALKYFPLVFIPLLLLEKKWKALSVMLITIAAIYILAYYYCGTIVYQQFIRSIFISHLNGELSSQSEYSAHFQSWNAFLKNIFVFDPLENKSPLINSSIAFYAVRNILIISILLFTEYVIVRIIKENDFTAKGIIVLSIFVFVLSPASASYHLLLLSLPLLLLLDIKNSGFTNNIKLLLIIIYIAIGYLSFILNKVRIENAGLFFSFYGLWLNVIFFGIASLLILKNTNQGIDAK